MRDSLVPTAVQRLLLADCLLQPRFGPPLTTANLQIMFKLLAKVIILGAAFSLLLGAAVLSADSLFAVFILVVLIALLFKYFSPRP